MSEGAASFFDTDTDTDADTDPDKNVGWHVGGMTCRARVLLETCRYTYGAA